MNGSSPSSQPPHAARIPSNLEQPDTVVGRLTARQAMLLATAGLLLWLLFKVVGDHLSPVIFGGLVLPLVAAWSVIVLGRRDGLSLDRWLLSAWRYRQTPTLRTAHRGPEPPLPEVVHPDLAAMAPPLPTPLLLPGSRIASDGCIDLGREGTATLAECSGVNFALRTAEEQRALTSAFGRWLNSLTAPVQFTVRARRIDLTRTATQIEEAAPALPHPALEQAARDHAAYLAQLSTTYELLGRRIVLTTRVAGSNAEGRAAQHREEAVRALAAADVSVTALDGAEASRHLAACCNPSDLDCPS
ncbi:PrgI family protein [Streptomyces sp. NPDC050315]|uniref:PrgI family protein n=1 Tax=Streptomyces sp. NPDC050315 TaxID=3155039 RepID=UPI00342CC45E